MSTLRTRPQVVNLGTGLVTRKHLLEGAGIQHSESLEAARKSCFGLDQP